jgi:nucleotide-binding universal stress UspA family protein
MFDRILVPLDGSMFAEAAFPAACAVAERFGGEIRLLRVRPHLWVDEAVELERALDQEVWAYLADASTRLRAMTSVPVSSDSRRGHVPEEIVAEAETSHDLIVMTSHGRGGLSRIWLGSATDACLRTTECPVLVVRPSQSGEDADFRIDRVVVPLDGSTVAEQALPAAVAFANAFRADVVLVRSVLAPVALDTALFPAPDWVPVDPGELVESARADLEKVAGGVETARGRPRVHVDAGRHAAIAIGDAAGRAGLVVMAAHAHSGWRRALLGSVTDKVVRTADGAVLVVRPRSEALARESTSSADRESRPRTPAVEA